MKVYQERVFAIMPKIKKQVTRTKEKITKLQKYSTQYLYANINIVKRPIL